MLGLPKCLFQPTAGMETFWTCVSGEATDLLLLEEWAWLQKGQGKMPQSTLKPHIIGLLLSMLLMHCWTQKNHSTGSEYD